MKKEATRARTATNARTRTKTATDADINKFCLPRPAQNTIIMVRNEDSMPAAGLSSGPGTGARREASDGNAVGGEG